MGKSTDLKLMIVRAIASGRPPTSVIYLTLDMLEGQAFDELVHSTRRAIELSGGGSQVLLLLDEATSVRRFQMGLKVLWDEGDIDRAVVVCTGSSATDLVSGVEEGLPGRRGSGQDLLVLPQDFGSYSRVMTPSIPIPPFMDVADVIAPAGQDLMRRMRVHLPDLQRALERYLVFGGLPAAVAESSQGSSAPSPGARRIVADTLLRELRRRGATALAAEALLERMLRSLGSKVSWARMAGEMGVSVGSKGTSRTLDIDRRTLQDYVELLAAGYFALVVHFWRPDSGTADLSKDKKIYFGDPLLHTITADRVGLPSDYHAQVENAVALHLFRRYETGARRAGTFPAPDRLHVWGTSHGGEIDFVCGQRNEIQAVEVADWAHLNRQKATAPMRALPGRPSLVATRKDLAFGPTSNLVPAALLLWALSGVRP